MYQEMSFQCNVALGQNQAGPMGEEDVADRSENTVLSDTNYNSRTALA